MLGTSVVMMNYDDGDDHGQIKNRVLPLHIIAKPCDVPSTRALLSVSLYETQSGTILSHHLESNVLFAGTTGS